MKKTDAMRHWILGNGFYTVLSQVLDLLKYVSDGIVTVDAVLPTIKLAVYAGMEYAEIGVRMLNASRILLAIDQASSTFEPTRLDPKIYSAFENLVFHLDWLHCYGIEGSLASPNALSMFLFHASQCQAWIDKCEYLESAFANMLQVLNEHEFRGMYTIPGI